MALDLKGCKFLGPALPEPFVNLELERLLSTKKLLPKTTGAEGKALKESWEIYRRTLRELVSHGGATRVFNHLIDPLVSRLGYARTEVAGRVETREDKEDGGTVLVAEDGSRLRAFANELDTDLDAPAKRGQAYRFSPVRVAQRVLLASGERVGLLTDGVELRVLLSDPARPDSEIIISVDPDWKRSREVPDSYRLLLALASPAGVKALPEIIEAARLQQTRVTKELRKQARQAIELFVNSVVENGDNRKKLAGKDSASIAKSLWREGLVLVYRLLFIFKLESFDDLARAFSFASSSLWRNTYSPTTALARHARRALDDKVDTGNLLEGGLRQLFKMFAEGLSSVSLNVAPLGGALFGAEATPLLSSLTWGERACALLLDQLLWTPKQRGSDSRERVHYGPLDVEDLGRVYEALLELEPGIATEAMCRLRRSKLEVVVPVAQGERYRPAKAGQDDGRAETADESDEGEDEPEEESQSRAKKAKVEWVEEIRRGRFYLRVGLGRKATGSYYTPHSFVRFLIQEALGPQVGERSPKSDPTPGEILKLRVLDPAMGSGHFLVEACRFLGEKLYEACRLCDERALAAESRAEKLGANEKEAALADAREMRARLAALPDPDDSLVRYLPSRSAEGADEGVSQKRAEAICRRMIAVHCLYGVDKNPLAVELAKLALWMESHAEGLPLTFLDHRLVLGDSLTGPFFHQLLTFPGNGGTIDEVLSEGLSKRFTLALEEALVHVQELEATVGITTAQVEAKRAAKERLDAALAPLKIAAAAWAGGVMLGEEGCDDTAYLWLIRMISATRTTFKDLAPRMAAMIACGLGVQKVPETREELLDLLAARDVVPALPFDLVFPEVFFEGGSSRAGRGFDAVVGNPPWEVSEVSTVEVVGMIAPEVMRGRPGELERTLDSLDNREDIKRLISSSRQQRARVDRGISRVAISGRTVNELSACFAQRMRTLSRTAVGVVLPDAFHRNKEQAWLREDIWSKRELHRIAGFSNSEKLFLDLPQVVNFDLVVLGRPRGRNHFMAQFRQTSDSVLADNATSIEYPWSLALDGNPESRSLIETRTTSDARICAGLYARNSLTLGSQMQEWKISLTQEVNQRTFGASLIEISTILEADADARQAGVTERLLSKQLAPLLEGKSVMCFDVLWKGVKGSHWNPVPSLAFPLHSALEAVAAKSKQIRVRLPFYRIFGRQTCGSPLTNERSAVFCMGFPGLSAVHSAISETMPGERPSWAALVFLALVNTFSFDYLIRQQVGANLSLFILEAIRIPGLDSAARRFLAHAALRLSCQHREFETLWREQVRDEWREPTTPSSWPVLASDDDRWAVRCAIDAVVASAYELNRDEYEHVLSTFTHRSYPGAPRLCLERFDEIESSGVRSFFKKHDSYWDIPLTDSLPEPVLRITGPADPEEPGLFASKKDKKAEPSSDSNSGTASSSRKGKRRSR